MVAIDNLIVYKAYGFSIISELQLPELPNLHGENESADIEIVFENLEEMWKEHSNEEYAFAILDKTVMFEVPEVAIFSISRGSEISISPLQEYDENLVRLYVLGICMGVILMQRGIFPLHGSSIVIDGKAYAFVGNSGAGKSTLASCFLKNGYKFLSDDVIAISVQEGKEPFVTPSFPNRKLWKESLSFLGMNEGDYKSIYGRETKYSVPVLESYFSEPLPLGGVFELTKKDIEEVEIVKIPQLESLYTLYYHTFQRGIVRDLGIMDWHFQLSNKLLENQLNVYRITRPTARQSANELVSLIISTIKKES